MSTSDSTGTPSSTQPNLYIDSDNPILKAVVKDQRSSAFTETEQMVSYNEDIPCYKTIYKSETSIDESTIRGFVDSVGGGECVIVYNSTDKTGLLVFHEIDIFGFSRNNFFQLLFEQTFSIELFTDMHKTTLKNPTDNFGIDSLAQLQATGKMSFRIHRLIARGRSGIFTRDIAVYVLIITSTNLFTDFEFLKDTFPMICLPGAIIQDSP